ncbi:MAG: preprotein translocase subunit SecG [Pseudomonadota bacterium]
MFTTFILVVHVIVSIAMILIILLQTGKGADIGAAFGGGSSQTVFGSTGATTFLSKVTIVSAVIFMTTSFVLTYVSGKGVSQVQRSIVTESTVPQTPVPGAAQDAPGKDASEKIPATTPAGDTGKPAGAKPDVPEQKSEAKPPTDPAKPAETPPRESTK